MAFSDLASSLYIVLLNVKFTTMASNSHKNDTDKSYSMSVGAKSLRLVDKTGWQNDTGVTA